MCLALESAGLLKFAAYRSEHVATGIICGLYMTMLESFVMYCRRAISLQRPSSLSRSKLGNTDWQDVGYYDVIPVPPQLRLPAHCSLSLARAEQEHCQHNGLLFLRVGVGRAFWEAPMCWGSVSSRLSAFLSVPIASCAG